MKKAFLCLIIFALVISGCAEKGKSINRNFKGESEHWFVYYSVQGSTVNQIEKARIIYKGSDANMVGKVKYLLETTAGEIGGEQPLSEDGYINTGKSSSGAAVVQKDEEIKASIDWNGQVENLTLKPSNEILDI